MAARDEFANRFSDSPSETLHVSGTLAVPLMTRESFAAAIGLPLSVFVAQCDRGYWPTVKVGKYSFVNVELVRKSALAREFSV